MSLTPVDLPNPADINRVMAAHAAVLAMLGQDDDFVFAEGNERHGGSGSGDDWARLVLLPGGRAVLYGMEIGDADFVWWPTWLDAPAGLEPNPLDLLAGAPDWWHTAIADIAPQPLTFIYGHENGDWCRASHDLRDGFTNVLISTTDDDAARAISEELFELDPEHPAILDVVRAGADVTAEQLDALLQATLAMLREDEGEDAELDDWLDASPDVAAGVAKARTFRLPEGH